MPVAYTSPRARGLKLVVAVAVNRWDFLASVVSVVVVIQLDYSFLRRESMDLFPFLFFLGFGSIGGSSPTASARIKKHRRSIAVSVFILGDK